MKPMQIAVAGTNMQVTYCPTLTSGTQGLGVNFTFDNSWDGLTKTAVFRCGKVCRGVTCRENAAQIPWEVLEVPASVLYVGVYGTNGAGKILPTVWTATAVVEPGAWKPEETVQDPTPDIYGQIFAIAQSVREDADSGKFTPQKGVDYFTQADRKELVQAVLNALPVYNGEVEAV